MIPPVSMERPASIQLREALRQRGYRPIGAQSIRTRTSETVWMLWSNGRTQLLMETHIETTGEVACELYKPLTQSNSLADTIAAIP